MRILAIAVGAVVLLAPGASLAQVTQSYSYDANGRLIGVTTSNGVSTNTAAYAYDDADNRTSRAQTGASTWAAVSRLPAHRWLRPDEALVSPDGRYSLAFRPSGRMELWFGDAPVGSEALAAAFQLADDGQARFLPPGISGAPTGAGVSLRDDGRLALTSEAGAELWRSGDASGREVAR